MTEVKGNNDDGATWRGLRLLGAAALLSASATALAAPASADAGHRHPTKMIGGHPGKKSEVTRTIRIVATDMKFDRKTITVKAGETIRFVVVNKGEQVHDLTLGTPVIQAAHRKSMMKMMNNGMDLEKMDHSDPNAVMVKPGETKELIWKFSKARSFEFGCNVPGHYEAGMKGSITIR